MAETFEAALADTERATDAALRAAATVTVHLRKARLGAKTGQVKDLRKALKAAEDAASALAAEASALRANFSFDEQAYLADGRYAKEMLSAAADAGVTMHEEDERLICYPSLIKILPSDSAIEIDKKRERGLRPSVLVAQLAVSQGRPPRFRPEPFLDSMRNAYELVVRGDDRKPDAVVRLLEVWAVLTLLPGQTREYTKQEFARDLYLLDQSGVIRTPRSERRLRWSASTGTKGSGVLTTVARDGQQQRYWGVSFTQDGD